MKKKWWVGEICKAGIAARDGVDAFAFVINLTQRFSDDSHLQAIHILNAICSNFWNYIFIIFTHEDKMKSRVSSPDEYIRLYLKGSECPQLLIAIMLKARCTYMSVESAKFASNNEYWQQKCKEFLGRINVVRNANGNVRFDSVLLSKGKELYTKCLRLDAENEKLRSENDKIMKELETLKKRTVPDELVGRFQIEINQMIKRNEEMQTFHPDSGVTVLSVFLGVSISSVATLVGVALLKFIDIIETQFQLIVSP